MTNEDLDEVIVSVSEEKEEPKEESKDWRDFPTRERNTMIVALTEGDVLVEGDVYRHVVHGEIYIYADGTINEDNGELAEVSIDGVQVAIATGKEIFNLEDAI